MGSVPLIVGGTVSPSCSTGPQSPVPPVCQMQLVPGTEQGQRADASAVARAAEDHVADAHHQSLTLITRDLTDQC